MLPESRSPSFALGGADSINPFDSAQIAQLSTDIADDAKGNLFSLGDCSALRASAPVHLAHWGRALGPFRMRWAARLPSSDPNGI